MLRDLPINYLSAHNDLFIFFLPFYADKHVHIQIYVFCIFMEGKDFILYGSKPNHT